MGFPVLWFSVLRVRTLSCEPQFLHIFAMLSRDFPLYSWGCPCRIKEQDSQSTSGSFWSSQIRRMFSPGRDTGSFDADASSNSKPLASSVFVDFYILTDCSALQAEDCAEDLKEKLSVLVLVEHDHLSQVGCDWEWSLCLAIENGKA